MIIMQHFSDCDGNAIFRISLKKKRNLDLFLSNRMQFDPHQTSSKFRLTWVGVHVLRVLSKHYSKRWGSCGCFQRISDRKPVYTKNGSAPNDLLPWRGQFVVVVHVCCSPTITAFINTHRTTWCTKRATKNKFGVWCANNAKSRVRRLMRPNIRNDTTAQHAMRSVWRVACQFNSLPDLAQKTPVGVYKEYTRKIRMVF
jgi:hypothetical protein